jgi:hypothetical protein
MAGLQLADAIGHGLNTYAKLQGIQDNKERSLRDAQSFEMDKQAFQDDRKYREEQRQQNQQMHNIRMRQFEQADQERLSALLAKKLYAMDSGGNFSDAERQEYLKLTGGSRLADPEYLSRPEVGAALEIYPKVISGEIHRNDPRAIDAYNTLINVQRGATEGRQVRINRVEPSGDGQGVYLGLHVKNADGTENPNGVLTDNRSADPADKVSSISFDELNEIYGNATKMRSIIANPKYRQALYAEYGLGASEKISAKDQSLIDKNKSQSNYYNAKASATAKAEANGGGGSGKGMPAKAQMISFYKSLGYGDEDAISMANDAASSPEKFAITYSKMLFEASKDYNGQPTISPEDAFKKSMEIYNGHFKKAPKKENSNQQSFNDAEVKTPVIKAPQAAIDFLKANPDQAHNFKAKYGYLPE